MKATKTENLTRGQIFFLTRHAATEWQIGSWDEGMRAYRVFNTANPSEHGYLSRDRVVWIEN